MNLNSPPVKTLNDENMADIRTLYQSDVDFALLALQSPPFKKQSVSPSPHH